MNLWQLHAPGYGLLTEYINMPDAIYNILGDPGAVSRVRRKGATKLFKYGRKSPWVPTLIDYE